MFKPKAMNAKLVDIADMVLKIHIKIVGPRYLQKKEEVLRDLDALDQYIHDMRLIIEDDEDEKRKNRTD